LISVRYLIPVLLAVAAGPVLAIDIDGRVAVDEWRDARKVDDFRKVQPFDGEPASLKTEAWILATPGGLAVAFRNTHPGSVQRTRQRVQRDFDAQVDHVNVIVDFDGDRRTGYSFRVSSTNGIHDAIVTNETNFKADWDGNWRHAVTEDEESWTVELLIPWHIAPMRDRSGDKRTFGIYLARVIGSTGERAAWPLASFERSRFLSEFATLEVPSFSQALLALMPYASSLYDNVRTDGDSEAGLDLFWKPNGQAQLSATVNPDFGQVESDNLVVNFDATEPFVSEKRPFFTENQGIFEYTTPSDSSQLLYTRRIGGPADHGLGSGDITSALKLNGSIGAAKYGVFAVDEADDVGRTFGALRLVRDFSAQNLGLMATYVDRPFIERQATVLGVDHDWRPTSRWNLRTRIFGSDIAQNGSRTSDTGATISADYEMDRGWRQQWIGMHFGDELQVNDAGYLARNSLNYAHWQFNRRFTELPAASRYSSKDWRWRASSVYNDHGDLLQHQLRMSRESRTRNGSYEYAQINVNSAGVNDLLTRGHGALELPPLLNTYFQYQRPRKGSWAFNLGLEAYGGGLSGNHQIGYRFNAEPIYFVSDGFNVYVVFIGSRTPDWLVWQRDTLIGSFESREAQLKAGFNWTVTNRQELRLKLQAVAVNARLRQAYRVMARRAVESDEPVDDFSVRTLGFQIRYRFELAPLSYLYVVYGRGGYRQAPVAEDSLGLVRESFSLRDDEQLLVKFSYRFEK
jgi:hypothetical protein